MSTLDFQRVPQHGDPSEYTNHHCRCDVCGAANSRQHAKWDARRRARQAILDLLANDSTSEETKESLRLFLPCLMPYAPYVSREVQE